MNSGKQSAAPLLAPLATLGIWIGVGLHRRISQRTFVTASDALLLATGLKLIQDAVDD